MRARSASFALALALSGGGCMQPLDKEGGDDPGAAGAEDPEDAAPDGEEPDGEEVPNDGPNWGDAGRGGVDPEPEPEPEAELPDACAEVADLRADGSEPEAGVWVIDGENGVYDRLSGSCGGGEGGDVVFRFEAPEAGVWRFETLADRTDFDSLLYVRTTCDDTDSELGCNDDILEGRVRNSRVDATLEAAQVVWIVVDAWGEGEGGAFALATWRVPELPPGAECDPEGEESVCSVGHFCRLEEPPSWDNDEWAPGVCEESAAPVLISASARVLAGTVLLTATGADASRDVAGLSLQFMIDGRAVTMGRGGRGRDTFPMGFDESVYGLAEFEGARTVEQIFQFGAVDGVRLALLDSEGNTSEWVELELEWAPEIAEGGACDPAGLDNTCVEGAICVVPAAAEGAPDPLEGVCQIPSAPTLTGVEAFFNERTLAIGLRVEGADPDKDLASATLRLFDVDGDRVPSASDGPGAAETELTLTFEDVAWEGDRFAAAASGGLPVGWEGVHSVRVRVLDARGLQSEGLEVDVAPTPEWVAGQPCDSAGGLTACPNGGMCDPVTAECGEAVAECPDDWEVIDLADHQHEGSRFVYRGDTEGAENHGAGSCGGGAGQDVFRFTAPMAGEWLFETDIEGRFDDTVMYVRSHCRYGGPASELACNDDVEAGRMSASRIGLQLEEGRTVYVFVDGWMGDGFAWRGEYALVVSRP